MENPVWGLLQKAQDDAETIEEAIERIVGEHNDDSEAHLGEGRSLNSHAASEIIDHLADSIITDKILDGSVEISKISNFNRLVFLASLETLDCFVNSGGIDVNAGEFDIQTSSTINTERFVYARPGIMPDYRKNSKIQFVLQFVQYGNMNFYAITGVEDIADPAYQFYGFKIVGSTIYAVHAVSDGDTQTEYTTNVGTLSGYENHVYRAEYVHGVGIKFYIDGLQVAFHDTNLFNDDIWAGASCAFVYLKNTVASNKAVLVHQIYFEQNI